MSVLGPIDDLGFTLPHEHVLVDFIGAAEVSPDRYDPNEVFHVALPHLQQVRALGCRTLIECTPAYIGRDPVLLQRLSAASQTHILTNTGYYGAARNKFLPAHAFRESADQLAARWIEEWREGIGEAGIRPGFIKIGVDAGRLSEIHRKLVRAAARTHLATGLTIAAHTGDGTAALEQIDILKEEGVDPSAFIWVHAQSERNADLHARAAEQGAWVEFDGLSIETVEEHARLVEALYDHGYIHRVLVSHDAGWYHVGEPGGGDFRPYDTLFTRFLPHLTEIGFHKTWISQITVANPREAFRIQVRER